MWMYSLAVVTSLLPHHLTQLRSGCSQIWQFVLRGDVCYEFPGSHCGGVSKCSGAESISSACSVETKECAKQTAQCHEGWFLVGSSSSTLHRQMQNSSSRTNLFCDAAVGFSSCINMSLRKSNTLWASCFIDPSIFIPLPSISSPRDGSTDWQILLLS